MPSEEANALELSLAVSMKAPQRIWHIQDSQGRILTLTFWEKPLKSCKVLPFPSMPSEAARALNFQWASSIEAPQRIWRI